MEVGSDAVGCCDYFADFLTESGSEITDTEAEVEVEVEYACTPRAFERTVPRISKRTYGVVLDGEVVSERRKRSRVDEQLALLRAAVPNLCTNEKASILAGASKYIQKLLRQVQELHDELDTLSEPCSHDDDGDDNDRDDDGDVSSCEDSLSRRDVDSNAALEVSRGECCGCSHSTVDVIRSGDGGLRIHFECEKRPRVLAAIMEILESSGMAMEQVSITYHEDSRFVFDCIGSGVGGDGAADSTKCLITRLKSLIAPHREPSTE